MSFYLIGAMLTFGLYLAEFCAFLKEKDDMPILKAIFGVLVFLGTLAVWPVAIGLYISDRWKEKK